jgi:hypothetical protein
MYVRRCKVAAKGGGNSMGPEEMDPKKTQHDVKSPIKSHQQPPSVDAPTNKESSVVSASDSAKHYIKTFKKVLNPEDKKPPKS